MHKTYSPLNYFNSYYFELDSFMIDYRDLLLPSKALIIDAMRVIDRGAAQIALVVDGDFKLLGTLTDGDIRRGLLNDIPLTSTVDNVMNRGFSC